MPVISPNLLEFKAPFTEPSTEFITITNDSEQTIAFKVKTTAPKVYCVRPNAATLEPGKSIEVSVILLGLKEEPTPGFACPDKFLIVSLPSPYDLGENKVADVWPKLEAEFKAQSISKKIKVNYVLSNEVDVKDQSQEQASENALKSTSIPQTKEKKSDIPDEESEKERSKVVELNEKLDSNVAKSSSTAASSTTTQTQVATTNSTPFTTVFIIALISLIIGWLFF